MADLGVEEAEEGMPGLCVAISLRAIPPLVFVLLLYMHGGHL